MRNYDVIVVGAGHAGNEAALASARLGLKTAIFTITLDNIGVMSCNPSVGGPAKSHLAKEVDALGGEIGRNMDKSFVQMRILNTKKGPAVRSLRAQADRKIYAREMKKTIEHQENLDIVQDIVTELIVDEVEIEHGLSILMIVGENMKDHIGVTATAAKALSEKHINLEMISQGSSEVSVMFVIETEQEKAAVRALYDAFFRSND